MARVVADAFHDAPPLFVNWKNLTEAAAANAVKSNYQESSDDDKNANNLTAEGGDAVADISSEDELAETKQAKGDQAESDTDESLITHVLVPAAISRPTALSDAAELEDLTNVANKFAVCCLGTSASVECWPIDEWRLTR
ncbi:hypothetical protein HK102_014074 [Quaeritorhiza haematococci]|nr:hypothetical protein HK102_014074 [Quaeritorhiza haematococci]